MFNFNVGDCEKLVCRKGYEVDESGKCSGKQIIFRSTNWNNWQFLFEDINECERTPEICHENERCDNTIGSYKCVFILICEEGYELNANRTECVGK